MKDYIDIKPDFTLDKDIDNSAPTGKENVLTNLNNYIPKQGSISTRGGVSTFSFTDPSSPYVPSDDPDCLMHLRFEGNPSTFRDCEIQGANYMQVSAAQSISATTSQKREGSYSLYLDYWMPGGGLGIYYYKYNADLHADFPGQGGTGDCIFSFWSRFDNMTQTSIAVLKHDSETQVGGFSVKATDVGGGVYRWRWYVTSEEGSNHSLVNTQIQVYTGVWYHVGVWSSASLGKIGMVIYDANSGLEKYSSMAGSLGGNASTQAGYLLNVGMGRHQAKTYTDDFILCNVVPSTEVSIRSKIEWMRNRGM